MAQLLWTNLLVNKSCFVYYAARRLLRTHSKRYSTQDLRRISNICLVWQGDLCPGPASICLSLIMMCRPEIQFFNHSWLHKWPIMESLLLDHLVRPLVDLGFSSCASFPKFAPALQLW